MKHRPQDLEELIASSRLPSLPAVALEVIDLAQEPDLDVADLAETITTDPALAGKILRVANSSFYAQSRTISTVSQAIVLLGLNDVQSLALSFSLVDGLRAVRQGGFDHDAFWRRSLITGAASRLIARRIEHHHVEEVFLGGLLCRLGVLALSSTITERYEPLASEARDDYRNLLVLEKAALGFTHADAGECLAELWDLPASLAAVMCHVDSPDLAPDEARRFVRMVAAGDSAAEVLCTTDGDALARYRDRCAQWFEIPESAADLLLTEIEEATRDVLQLFDLPADSLPPVAEILGRANEALAEFSFEMSREKARLEVENQALNERASTDALTGLANRRHLVEFAQEQISTAIRYRRPLSLLFLDLDRFKSVNDNFGHQAGDRILCAVSSTVRQTARGADLVARYGGDEFAVVMPVTTLEEAQFAAERIREAVERAEFTLDDGTRLALTLSAGIAGFDGEGDDLDSMLNRADSGVHRAKVAGGNRVIATGQRRTC
jgi:diguanylate cyclase (GGDEF)-like protein